MALGRGQAPNPRGSTGKRRPNFGSIQTQRQHVKPRQPPGHPRPRLHPLQFVLPWPEPSRQSPKAAFPSQPTHLYARPHHEDKAGFFLKKHGKTQPSEPALRPGPLKHTLGFLLFARAQNPAVRGAELCVRVSVCPSLPGDIPRSAPCPLLQHQERLRALSSRDPGQPASLLLLRVIFILP